MGNKSDCSINIPENAYQEPLRWLENLELEQLQNWLEDTLCSESPEPIWVPFGVNYARYLADCLIESERLSVNIPRILPNLVGSWNIGKPTSYLESLLEFCAVFNCKEAEEEIIWIVKHGIRGLPDEIEVSLRIACLRILAGFGCTKQMSRKLFESFIDDNRYAGLCYRALYLFDPMNAAKYFTNIFEMFYEKDKETLEVILKTCFLHTLRKQEKSEVMKSIFSEPISDILIPKVLFAFNELLGLCINQVKQVEYEEDIVTVSFCSHREVDVEEDKEYCKYEISNDKEQIVLSMNNAINRMQSRVRCRTQKCKEVARVG